MGGKLEVKVTETTELKRHNLVLEDLILFQEDAIKKLQGKLKKIKEVIEDGENEE